MTKLQPRSLAVALREHQEEQRKDRVKHTHGCRGKYNRHSSGGYDGADACLYEWGCPCECHNADAEEQAKKDAGDERLLCAVLYEGKGEPN
jgi:hypothetical protein